MIAWKKQGAAFVGSLQLADGTKATAVVVGAPTQPRGAVIVSQDATGAPAAKAPLADCLDRVGLIHSIDILCMQERAFGSHGLTPPDLT